MAAVWLLFYSGLNPFPFAFSFLAAIIYAAAHWPIIFLPIYFSSAPIFFGQKYTALPSAKDKGRRLKVKTATKNKQRCIFLFFSYWRLLFFAALLFSLPANIFPFVLLPFVCFEFWPAINISFSWRLFLPHFFSFSRLFLLGQKYAASGQR